MGVSFKGSFKMVSRKGTRPRPFAARARGAGRISQGYRNAYLASVRAEIEAIKKTLREQEAAGRLHGNRAAVALNRLQDGLRRQLDLLAQARNRGEREKVALREQACALYRDAISDLIKF